MDQVASRPPTEVLVFEVGGRRYGLPSADVQELFRVVTITPTPRMSDVIEGVINLRGRVVPVLDIRSRLRLPAREVEPTDHLLVARLGDRLVAIRVERALELLPVNETDVEESESIASEAHQGSRMVKFPDGLVPIIDLRTFLTPSESLALGKALPSSLPSPSPLALEEDRQT